MLRIQAMQVSEKQNGCDAKENLKLRTQPTTLLPSQYSVKLCMETLTALWGVKGMARLRYLVHMASFASTQEHHTVF